ncbi:TetR/AcrR family transcriptional regulator [Aquipuribacter nitratireducens]|uniref:TetR/AcrR family transcriptional regulator n=1 Tax=Aquipuribacter nitratireducens TaxID=650104 RepID=A0ABW0GV57_9MICO
MAPSVGRPLGFERDAALDAVVDAFWTHGYAGATTSLLEASTGLARSSLLNTFGPKDRLCLAAVDRYQERMDAWLVAPMASGEEGVADLERFFDVLASLKESPPGSSGCLVVNLSAEAPARLEGMAQRVERYRSHLRDGFVAALGRAERLGEITPGSRAQRADLLLGIAVAVNWTARSVSAQEAQRLARSAAALPREWAGC